MSTNTEVLVRALGAAVGVEGIEISALFTDDIVAWSPTLLVLSLSELKQALAEREAGLSNQQITIDGIDELPDKVIAEWRMTAEHTGSLVIDDVEFAPTMRQLVLAGATFADFRAGRICSFRSYFDDAALLEQLIIPA